jgi:hypothetical protein
MNARRAYAALSHGMGMIGNLAPLKNPNSDELWRWGLGWVNILDPKAFSKILSVHSCLWCVWILSSRSLYSRIECTFECFTPWAVVGRESIRLERRANNDKLAAQLMARALQECPNSGG